ncbi:radical SAM protein [Candidatus Falkowbacteria bacterium]|nr:radical SAM protein [Candidatus Falkowbacteria bacterium]
MNKVNLPIDCVLAVTYRCNSRCTMCDIWKLKDTPELELEQYKKLPPTLCDINVSGGEPFLRQDIVDLVRILHETCPKARTVISTNGYLTDLIKEKMREILKYVPTAGVGISIDGIGEMHDKIRGIPGGFNLATKTVKVLREEVGMNNLRLAFTISKQNILHMSKVYDLSRELGVQFTLALAQSSEFFFGGKQVQESPDINILKEQFNYVIRQELHGWQPKRWARTYFADSLYNFAKTGKQALPSRAGTDFFFLDPFGKVYPSVVHNAVMGNLHEKNFEEIWNSPEAEAARAKVREAKQDVWMICTARTAIKNHPFRVGWWIFRNKFKR